MYFYYVPAERDKVEGPDLVLREPTCSHSQIFMKCICFRHHHHEVDNKYTEIQRQVTVRAMKKHKGSRRGTAEQRPE